MTSPKTPIHILRAQARRMAKVVKAAERGQTPKDAPPAVFAGLLASRSKSGFRMGIVMDDKLVTLEYEWAVVAQMSEQELAEHIVLFTSAEPTPPKNKVN